MHAARAFLAGLAVAMLAGVPPAAQAHPAHHYRGGCAFTYLGDDGTADGWTVEVHLAAVATTARTTAPWEPDDSLPTPADAMTGSCDLRVNGDVHAVLGPFTGTGAVAGMDTFRLAGSLDVVVELCDDIVVAGAAHYVCERATTTPIPPDEVTEILDGLPWETVDLVPCTAFAALAPTVNALNQPDVVRIDEDAPEEGGADLWVVGAETWLCPDYER